MYARKLFHFSWNASSIPGSEYEKVAGKLIHERPGDLKENLLFKFNLSCHPDDKNHEAKQ